MMKARFLLSAIASLALSACSEKPAGENSQSDVAPDAAPGIAVTYDYRFALAARAIAPMQEKHAAACEALGPQRCRITGVSLHRDDATSVRASLDLALDPALARRFGRDASAQVETDQGTVRDIEISTRDVSRAIRDSDAAAQAARDDRARLRIAAEEAKGSGRAALEQQISDSRAQESEAAAQATEARVALATTPMRFTYATDGFVPRFSLQQTATGAIAFAGHVLDWLLATLIVLASIAIPGGLLALAGTHIRRWLQMIWQRFAAKPLSLPPSQPL